ncbi:hypothetical protein AXA44_44225 [Rhodococcus sp. SC4]|nr:hypothetical protein AXA44_44225 [Rhodococcus sp. SC4]
MDDDVAVIESGRDVGGAEPGRRRPKGLTHQFVVVETVADHVLLAVEPDVDDDSVERGLGEPGGAW